MARKEHKNPKAKAPSSPVPQLTNSNNNVTIILQECLDAKDESPFGKWFAALNAAAAAKVAIHLKRIELGNFSNVEPVGEGVLEKKIDWGPGYRVYFGRDGEMLVVLLGGSAKADQAKAIKMAKALWQDYKKRRKDKTHGTHKKL